MRHTSVFSRKKEWQHTYPGSADAVQAQGRPLAMH